MTIRPTTQGERLFLLLRDQMLDSFGQGHARWSNFCALMTEVGGRPEFGGYLRGVASIHVMRRLLRFWEMERQNTPQESQYVRKVASYVQSDVIPSLGTEDASRLARAVIAAEKSSRQTISPTVRARLIGGRSVLRCYLCPDELDPRAPEDSPAFLTLEHVWPQSAGGDSVEENLLPACKRCQDATKDSLSWEWFSVHNLVLPIEPSAGAIASVSRKGFYARHFLEAMRTAGEEHLSLKEAFVRLGPIRRKVYSKSTGEPTTFFDLVTVE